MDQLFWKLRERVETVHNAPEKAFGKSAWIINQVKI